VEKVKEYEHFPEGAAYQVYFGIISPRVLIGAFQNSKSIKMFLSPVSAGETLATY
jgi:hypothetical protein